jgi:hypothetical protein
MREQINHYVPQGGCPLELAGRWFLWLAYVLSVLRYLVAGMKAGAAMLKRDTGRCCGTFPVMPGIGNLAMPVPFVDAAAGWGSVI